MVQCGKRPTSWITYPIRLRNAIGSRLRRSWPSNRISPASYSRRRFIKRSAVVFPEPLRPRSTSVSPSSTSSDTSSRTVLSPRRQTTFRNDRKATFRRSLAACPAAEPRLRLPQRFGERPLRIAPCVQNLESRSLRQHFELVHSKFMGRLRPD